MTATNLISAESITLKLAFFTTDVDYRVIGDLLQQ